MIPYENILGMAFNRPLLITPQKADVIGAVLLQRLDARSGGRSSEQGIEEFQTFEATTNTDGSVSHHSPRASRFIGAYPRDEKGKPAPYRVHEGVAIITIVGSLCNRGAWIGASSGLVSYEGIMHQLSTATADERVKSILLDMQSPGGEAIGCFEVAAAVRKAATQKKVVGLVNGMACSAAYAILSGCTERYTTPSGISGSIGVVMMHMDFSRYLANEGVKPTFIHAGAHKVDGNPYEPLRDDVKADLQAEVDQFYDAFVSCVATGTRLSEKAIRATEARTYIGEEAVKVGLVDKVATIEEIIEAMTASEMTQPQPVVMPINPGDDKKTSADQGGDMSLKSELLAFLGIESKESADTPEAKAPEVAPIAEAEKPAAPAVVHLESDAVTCEDQTGAKSKDLASVNCPNCLRAEIAQRDQASRAAAEQAEVDAAAERNTRMEADAKAFEAKCANVGADGTKALVARFRAAQESGDTVALADLETIASSFVVPGSDARVPEKGPSAEDLAKRVGKFGGDHFAALEIVEKQGITQHDPKFGVAYGKALASLSTDGGARG